MILSNRGFSYLQNNKTLKLITPFIENVNSFSYLQNNKTLKRAMNGPTGNRCFSYLQNNKTLKPLTCSAFACSGFSYLQNNKTLKHNLLHRIRRYKIPPKSIIYIISYFQQRINPNCDYKNEKSETFLIIFLLLPFRAKKIGYSFTNIRL